MQNRLRGNPYKSRVASKGKAPCDLGGWHERPFLLEAARSLQRCRQLCLKAYTSTSSNCLLLKSSCDDIPSSHRRHTGTGGRTVLGDWMPPSAAAAPDSCKRSRPLRDSGSQIQSPDNAVLSAQERQQTFTISRSLQPGTSIA